MNLMIGDKNWLDFMNAEILTVGNSNFTCRGKEGATGGSMIDYFIISKNLVPLVRQLVAVFDVPWGPHFGLSLTLNARPSEVWQIILIKPTLPANVIEMQKPKVVKKKVVIECKIERQKARSEEAATVIEEQKANEDRWKGISNNTEADEMKLSQRDPLQKSMYDVAVLMGFATE